MRVEGLNKLRGKMNALARKHGQSAKVAVGYTQAYALHVHERQMRHRVGQWKYLETPAREKAGEMYTIVKIAVRGGATLEQGLLMAGMRLQRESQLLVPVDTGALKNSAYTRKE